MNIVGINISHDTSVCLMQDGKIIKTGDKSLAKELENNGYDWLN